MRLSRVLAHIAAISLAVESSASTFPAETWDTSSPDEVGLDVAKLQQLQNLVGGTGLIIRHGYLAYSWGDISQTIDWASASKPLLTTMLFRAEQLGYTSIHTPVGTFLPGGSPADSAITFFQLASMTSGYSRGEPADEAWSYNDYSTQLFGYVLFNRLFEMSPASAVAQELPFLQFQDSVGISSTQYGRVVGMSLRDFARLGLFWLNRGTWDGTSYIPESKFTDLVTNQVPIGLPVSSLDGPESWNLGSFGGSDNQPEFLGQGHYGMFFWVNTNGFFGVSAPPDVFAAIGHVGVEMCIMIPGLDLVAVGKGIWGHPATNAVQLLQDAVVDVVGVNEGQTEAATWGAVKAKYR